MNGALGGHLQSLESPPERGDLLIEPSEVLLPSRLVRKSFGEGCDNGTAGDRSLAGLRQLAGLLTGN
jgi:hypothetical protein